MCVVCAAGGASRAIRFVDRTFEAATIVVDRPTLDVQPIFYVKFWVEKLLCPMKDQAQTPIMM